MKHSEANQSHDTLLQFKFWQPKTLAKPACFNNEILNLSPPPKKQIILQGTRKHDIPPNGNFDKNHQLNRCLRISQVSVRVSLPTIPNSTWIHPRLGLPPHLASHVDWKGTHPVNAGTTPTRWSRAAWKGNEKLPVTETRRGLDN